MWVRQAAALALCAVACGGLAASSWAQGAPVAADDVPLMAWSEPPVFVNSLAFAARDWETGQASWYSHRFAGKRTASGEPYRQEAFTAAHRSLPLGTLVTVRNPGNDREVVVRINDRGPHHENRLIDLSQAAARALGILQQGVAAIELQLAPADAREPQPVRAERKPLSSGHSRRAVGVSRKPARG